MKAYDMINKQELDLDRKALIDLMLHDRQVDLAFDQVRSDADGYLSWDADPLLQLKRPGAAGLHHP